jgi:hypothetical protein
MAFSILPASQRSQTPGARPNPSRPKAPGTPYFKWVNTALGNIKAAIIGTYRAVNSKLAAGNHSRE